MNRKDRLDALSIKMHFVKGTQRQSLAWNMLNLRIQQLADPTDARTVKFNDLFDAIHHVSEKAMEP